MSAPENKVISLNDLAYARRLPKELVAAFGRLSEVLGRPESLSTDRDTIEEALIDEAIRVIKLASNRTNFYR